MNLKFISLLLAGNVFLLSAQKPVLNERKSIDAGIVIPLAMITYGLISLESDGLKKLDYGARNSLVENDLLWHNHWDDYVQFSPAALTFGLKLSGIEGKHSLPDMLLLYTLSNILDAGVVFTAKSLTGRERPDGSDFQSFPSGHTATAFVAAEFLNQEYGDKSIWTGIGAYGAASLVGLSRVYNNRHWLSDVIAGAGAGILSAKTVYWLYPYIKRTFPGKNAKRQAFICPGYKNGGLSVSFCCVF